MTPTTIEGSSRAKIAIFLADFGATGVVVNAIAIAGELMRRGAVVKLVAAQAEGSLLAEIPERVEVVSLLPVGMRLSRRQRLRKVVAPYRRFLKEFAPGVLLSAGNQGHLSSVAAAAGLEGVRLVVRVSNDSDHEARQRIKGLVTPYLRRLKLRRIARAADRMIFVSRRLLEAWAAIGAGDGSKAVVIANGVDADAVRRKASEPCAHPWLAGEIPVVLGVGRLVEQKNFEALVRAVALASKSRPMRLLLIGEGPLAERLGDQARVSGLGDNFAMIAPIANPMPYLARAAVVALPSWREGASNVLLEAIACGTAVVASRSAGNAEEVLDGGRFGLLVDPADPQHIAEALLIQLGETPVLPGARAAQFSRQAALHAYADLLTDEARHVSAAHGHLGRDDGTG